MSYNYTQFVSMLYNQVAAASSDPAWAIELPLVIDRAEQRLYRELDLLATRVTDTTGSLTAFDRYFTLPTDQGSFLVVEDAYAWTPAGTTSSQATRNQLMAMSKSFVEATYPSNNVANGVPRFFAMSDNATVIVGPVPDNNYQMEVVGTIRPTPLSSANENTILTTMLPDLFFACAMTEAMAYMRDPAAQMWEAEYVKLMASADAEEARKNFRSQGWTSQQPRAITTPPRV